LRQTSDRKVAPKNDDHLGYTDTLNLGTLMPLEESLILIIHRVL